MAVCLAFATGVSGCAYTSSFKSGSAPEGNTEAARIVLMPPDVELYVLTAGGLLEPKADWTDTAKGHVQVALNKVLAEKKAQLVSYDEPEDDPVQARSIQQLSKLHSVVGKTILVHNYQPYFALPTKKETFDYRLGSNVAALRERYDADYALFVNFRDSYTSAGRVVAIILVAAIAGVGIPGGEQVGFASLVDLKTGDIVWFNFLRDTSGDLRTAEFAESAIRNVLTDVPF